MEHASLARMQNLGWDASPDDIEKVAKEVLASVGVGEDEYSSITASSRQKNSGVDILFTNPSLLSKAKFAVRAAKIYKLKEIMGTPEEKQDAPVWLDRAKSREELKPARLVHRLHEYVSDVVKAWPGGGNGTKHMNGKYVNLNGARIAFSCKGRVIWTATGMSKFSEEERQIGGTGGDACEFEQICEQAAMCEPQLDVLHIAETDRLLCDMPGHSLSPHK
eukprot:70737-Karenia_brevis.AAC.1